MKEWGRSNQLSRVILGNYGLSFLFFMDNITDSLEINFLNL